MLPLPRVPVSRDPSVVFRESDLAQVQARGGVLVKADLPVTLLAEPGSFRSRRGQSIDLFKMCSRARQEELSHPQRHRSTAPQPNELGGYRGMATHLGPNGPEKVVKK